MKMYDSVSDFYEDKSIFITGGTGFLGKVLLEKLLFSCPGIDKIYVLAREKRDQNAEQRLQKLLENPIFTRLREQRPNSLKKLVPISGDVTEPNLGLKPQDERMLVEKVSIVIHTAATLKFNEPLDLALQINVEGTRKILDLCQRMKKVEVLMHTSTAYSNTDKLVVEEMVYPPPAELDDVYAEKHISEQSILNGHPNTYTFTKALAENLIVKHHGSVPVIIVRPSIVTAVIEDPVPGWVSNWNGATGLVTAVTKGLVRILYADRNIILDLVPVDYVSNLIIAAAAKSDRSKDLAVYNCCTSDCNPIRLADFIHKFREVTVANNAHIMPRPDLFMMTKSHIILLVITFLFQTIPAYLMDFWLFVQGKRTLYIKQGTLINQQHDVLSFFTTHSWIMRTQATRALVASLSPADSRLFPCRIQDINWREYVPVYWAGVRQFLEKKPV